MTLALKDLLPTLLKQDTHNWHITLLSNWKTIVGNLHEHVRLEKINHDTLILGVYDACWMQELYLLSPLLLNTINQSLEQPYIKQLRFKRAALKKNVDKKVPETIELVKTPVVTSAQHEALARIQDPQLRKALYDFLLRCHKEKL